MDSLRIKGDLGYLLGYTSHPRVRMASLGDQEMMKAQDLSRKFNLDPGLMHVQNWTFPRLLNYVVSRILDKIQSRITKDTAFAEWMLHVSSQVHLDRLKVVPGLGNNAELHFKPRKLRVQIQLWLTEIIQFNQTTEQGVLRAPQHCQPSCLSSQVIPDGKSSMCIQPD